MYNEAGAILRDCDGTPNERLAVVAWRSGRLVTDTMGHEPHAFACSLTADQEAQAARVRGGCILLHNHPGSSMPSFADIRSAARPWVRSSIVACHDGTVYELTCDTEEIAAIYEEIRSDVRRALPEVLDSAIIDERALATLYEENEEAKWFRLTKR